MKRQLSIRFLLLLLASAFLFGVGGHLVHGMQMSRNAGYLLAQSRKALANKDYGTSLKLISHYLTLHPEDGVARARLGVMLAKLAKLKKQKEVAFLTIERAFRETPGLDETLFADASLTEECNQEDKELAALANDVVKARLRLVHLAMDLRLYSDAKVHIDTLLQRQPVDAELLTLLGLCEEESGRLTNAIEAYDRAIKAEPTRVEAYVRLAATYRVTKQDQEADKVIESRMFEKNPNSVRARLAAVEYFRSQGRLTAAKKNLTDIAEQSREEKDVLLAAIDLALADNNQVEAREKTAIGQKLYPQEPQFAIVQASLELRSGKQAEAAKSLLDVLKSLPSTSAEIIVVADLLIEAGEFAEARTLVNRLRGEQAEPTVVDFLEAKLFLHDGLLIKAESLLLTCRQAFVRNLDLALRTELTLATCYDKLGRPDQRLDAAQRAVRINPVAVPARMTHASALIALGNADEALNIYRSLITRDSEQSIRLTIARVIVWQNRQRPIEQRDLTPAIDVLDVAPEKLKEDAEYYLVRAESLFALSETLPEAAKRKKRDEARRVIEIARNTYPKEPRFWVFLAGIAAATDVKSAIELLHMGEAEVGSDRIEFRMARLSLLGFRTDSAMLRHLEEGIEAFSSRDRVRLTLALADAHTRASSNADAERLIRGLHERNPNDLEILSQLFDAVMKKEDLGELTSLKEKIRAGEGEEGTVWRLADAVISWVNYRKTQDTQELRNAQIRLSEAGKRRPNWFRVPVLEGEIEEQLQHPDQAIEKYLQAIKLGAHSTFLISKTTYLLSTRGRHDEVRNVIESARRWSSEANAELSRIDAVNLLTLGGDTDQVLKRMEEAAPASSKEIRDQLFRGSLLTALGRTKEAEVAFRKAIELDSKSPEAWVALVHFLAQTPVGTKPESDSEKQARLAVAKAEIQKAALAMPERKRALALGTCYESIGDRSEAEKQYLLATQDGRDTVAQRNLANYYLTNGEVAKVEAILKPLTISSDPTMRRWARRTLALAWATSGIYAQSTESITLLDRNLAENADDPEDLRIRSLVLSTRPGDRAQSIKDLEVAFSKVHPNPAEEFLLAQLYEVDGDWAKANSRLLGLLSRRGGDTPSYMVYYIRALLRHDDLQAAADWLARLESEFKSEREKLERSDPKKKYRDPASLIEMRARVWVRQGQAAMAANVLRQFAQNEFDERHDPAILRVVGLLMAELKMVTEAEEMLKQYVAAAEMKSPTAVLAMAEFLARQNRVGEALVICSKALAKVNPEFVARMTVAVVRLGDASDKDFQEAERIVHASSQAKPESIDITISTADLRDAQGRYDEAKQMYKAILNQKPQTVLAANNLAWLLALHEGNHNDALRIIDEAISVAGPEGNLLDTRGVINLMKGNSPQASSDLTKAVAQQPLPVRYFHLAQAYQKSGNMLEAQRVMRKARDLGIKKRELHKLEWKSYDALISLIDR